RPSSEDGSGRVFSSGNDPCRQSSTSTICPLRKEGSFPPSTGVRATLPRRRSLALEPGPPLLHEGGDPFLKIPGAPRQFLHVSLVFQHLFQGGIGPLVQGPLDQADRPGRPFGQLTRPGKGFLP